MDYKPTITYSFSDSGDESLFLTLSTHLRKVLQGQTVQWKRSYGRVPHKLALDVKFLPLTSALLNRNDLVTRPYFHVFWTDCNDIDFYRSSVKGEIASWLSELFGNDIFDWLIVVVTGDGTTKPNKSKLTLPRTSLADRIKTDFCSKSPDRIQILQDPMKESTKTNESWSSLAMKLANFAVLCLEDAVTKYEDRVRAERERRNEKTWNFCSYFIMQEELAFMFEMLALHEEALIQYNELDAMFTQYLLNAHAGDVAHWLSSFTKPITRWRSLSLWRRIDGEARQMLIEDTASLIDVRNYLFARHCHLLFAIRDMKRVAELMHTFLHSTTLELDILEIELPPGAKECWVFMSCMELAQSLERTRDHFRNLKTATATEGNSDVFMKLTNNDLRLEIANLWNLARSKLLKLGELCGLMPDVNTSSENLQTVVDLISGMGEEEERDGLAKPPSLILREALSSKDNFRNQYLELSEMAMGTFKHTERYRSARNIGKDLAEFYMRSGQPGKAELFLTDCVRMYTNEGWPTLIADASQRLAQCYKELCNVRRYARLCCALMCNSYLSQKRRWYYCDELHSLSTDFGDHSLPILLAVFANVTSVQFVPAQTSFRHKSMQHILLHVHSKAPKPMRFHSLEMSLRHHELSEDENFDRSATSDILDEEQELDVLSYATFSSDEENSFETESLSSSKPASQISQSSAKKPTSKNHVRRKRRRYISTTSYDSIYAVTQKTPLGQDGTIQLIPMDEPFTEPSKCVANRLPPVIHVSYESEEKDEEIMWAGITCRSSKQLLRRQDSYQSLCSIHSSTTNIVMETYSDNFEVKNVTINPGDNVIEVPIDTSKPGHYTLRQLRLSINKLHFVLPRILPVIAFTTTKDKPTLTLEHEPRLYCNIEQIINMKMTTGDYELSESPDDRMLVVNTPKHLKICRVDRMIVESESGAKTEITSPNVQIEETRCSIEMPLIPVHSTITLSTCCVCTQPASHGIGHKFHRRTHSAPATTVHKRVQTSTNQLNTSNLIAVNGVGKYRTSSSNELKFPRSPFSRRASSTTRGSGESPVKKFLTFVREVADRVDVKTSKLEKDDSESLSDVSIVAKDDFLEVTLEEPSERIDMVDGHSLKSMKGSSSSGSLQISDAPSSHETMSNSSSLSSARIIPRITETPPVLKSSIHQRHTLAVHAEHSSLDDDKVHCNISFSLPWNDLPPVSTSVNFNKLLEFSHKLLKSHSSKNTTKSSSCMCEIVSVTVENSSGHQISLKNYSLKMSNPGNANITGFLPDSVKKMQPCQSMTFAWKVDFTTLMPLECAAQFTADILNYDSESSAITPISYKFEIENIQTIYTISTNVGESEEELVCGQMTTLEITVRRLRRDPEHEHTRGGQQLLMYQVVDTRGRWAVCGKSTGVLSVPISVSESDLGPPVATANLEVMPLVDGLLHRPNVVLQRYLKRRSSEFDEQLSSTESPVLKPPRLMDFRNGEVVNVDEYKQIKVLATPSEHPGNSDTTSDENIVLNQTKL